MMRLPLLILAFLSASCASQTLSPSQFTTKFLETLVSASPSTKASISAALEVQVESDRGENQTVFLDNAYKSYLQDPKSLDDILQRHLSSVLESLANKSQIDRTRIVPVVKDRNWLKDISRTLQDRGSKQPLENVFEDYNDELVIFYVQDSPKNIRYLTSADVKALGLSQPDLRPLAVENLKRLLPPIEIHKGPQVSMITAGGDYEASLLTFSDLWKSSQIEVSGDIVVAIPARDLLLVTGSKTPGGIPRLRTLASKAYGESAYRLTDALFVFRNGRFTMLPAE
jgi:uncharacterized protein YtpQ (UPF0354 family)